LGRGADLEGAGGLAEVGRPVPHRRLVGAGEGAGQQQHGDREPTEGCPGLAPGRFTFAATERRKKRGFLFFFSV
jgi:hypothetical protein